MIGFPFLLLTCVPLLLAVTLGSSDVQLDYSLLMAPGDYMWVNLDSLLSSQGIQRDNYKFLDLQVSLYQ